MAAAKCWASPPALGGGALLESLPAFAGGSGPSRGEAGHRRRSQGLRAAASKVFAASQQRCRVHWMRNALAHAAPKQRPAVIAMIKTIFAQETAEAAHQQWEQVADALREKFPKLADMMDASREDVLAYMAFPKGSLGADRVHQPAGKGQQGDQAKGRRDRHLPK
jgi:hypothetical protein